MKKTIREILFIFFVIMILPTVFFISGLCTPSKYSQTYYGELAQMLERLKNSEKKKIVIIGNSSVAFGVDSALIEQELSLDGLDYDVCNFGLYGSIGTKAMLDLSEKYIGEGDVVIFTPEMNQQSMSLYFSGEQMWYAVDSDLSLLSDLKDIEIMVGSYPQYVVNKLKTEPVQGNGVYAKASFDDRGDMKNAERAYNIMLDGVDSNNLFRSDIVWDDAFTNYVNSYYHRIRAKGGTMVYSFAPMNRKAFKEGYEKALDDYYTQFSEKLDFLILGDPHTAVMDYEWFYDSNVHLNASGMRVRTISLINDLKLYFEKITPVRTEYPQKPVIPDREEEGGQLDDTYFLYEKNQNGTLIVGLTEKGKLQKSLSIPSSVYAFTAEVFQNNQIIEEITLPASIRILYDGSFSGADSLKKLVILGSNPERISVGYSLLEGADSCKIYVKKEAFSAFSSNYYWGHYAAQLEIG